MTMCINRNFFLKLVSFIVKYKSSVLCYLLENIYKTYIKQMD